MILSWLFDAIVGPDGPAVRAMMEECDRKEKEEKKFKRNWQEIPSISSGCDKLSVLKHIDF